MIYFTSDLHLGHDRAFVYEPRGYSCVEAMNSAILYNWNSVITPEDDVYVLGDLMLGDNSIGMNILKQLNGNIHIIRGNHDTDNRLIQYKMLPNVVEICDAKYLKYKKYHFYLTHYPCLTGNLQKESLSQMTLNLHGHIHSNKKFFYDLPYCYNVAVDAHDCTPISIDKIILDMYEKVAECLALL